MSHFEVKFSETGINQNSDDWQIILLTNQACDLITSAGLEPDMMEIDLSQNAALNAMSFVIGMAAKMEPLKFKDKELNSPRVLTDSNHFLTLVCRSSIIYLLDVDLETGIVQVPRVFYGKGKELDKNSGVFHLGTLRTESLDAAISVMAKSFVSRGCSNAKMAEWANKFSSWFTPSVNDHPSLNNLNLFIHVMAAILAKSPIWCGSAQYGIVEINEKLHLTMGYKGGEMKELSPPLRQHFAVDSCYYQRVF